MLVVKGKNWQEATIEELEPFYNNMTKAHNAIGELQKVATYLLEQKELEINGTHEFFNALTQIVLTKCDINVEGS